MRTLVNLFIAILAAAALSSCSLDATPTGGVIGNTGSASMSLTQTPVMGTTYTFVGNIRLTCIASPPGGCMGGPGLPAQPPVTVHTTAADTSITFPSLRLGDWALSIPGAPPGTLLGMGPGEPYCTYTGPRMGFQGCSFESYSPLPIQIHAGTTSTVDLGMAFHFSDGFEFVVFTNGNVSVSIDPTEDTVCGASATPCDPMAGEVCAVVDGGAPSCQRICVLDDPLMLGGPYTPVGPLPAPVFCGPGSACMLIDCMAGSPGCPSDGTGSLGAGADRGLCLPLPPPPPPPAP